MAYIVLMNFIFAVSTTIGMTLIPLLTTEGLGLSLLMLGIIEGSSEFLSNMLRLITGNIFDRLKDKRLLFIIPSFIALCAKIILCSPSITTILVNKILERISNGAFAAPRDAFIGISAKNKAMALAFLNISKTLGCIIGPLLVSGCAYYIGPLRDNMLHLFVFACFINFVALILSFLVRSKKLAEIAITNDFSFLKLKLALKSSYGIIAISCVFFLGRFNDGIIMLYLKNCGFPEWFYLSTISFFNLVMLASSPFMGYYLDRGHDHQILLITILSLVSFNLFFFNISYLPWLFASLGLIAWGIQRIGAQITFTAIIFKTTPINYHGTAIGIFSFFSGFSTFISSLLCGYLAQTSFISIFIVSFIFSAASLLFVLIYPLVGKS